MIMMIDAMKKDERVGSLWLVEVLLCDNLDKKKKNRKENLAVLCSLSISGVWKATFIFASL